MIRFFKNDIVSDPGDRMHPIYKPVVDNLGRIELKVTGYEDTDEIIESYRESADIEIIMKRIANGEVDLLDRHKGYYGDFTQMPKTYAEMLQLQIDSKNMFDHLPVEIKKKFNNDANEFFAQSGSKEWYDNLGDLIPQEKSIENTVVNEQKGEE